MKYKDQLVTGTGRIFDGKNPATTFTVHDTGNQSIGADAQNHADLQSKGTARDTSWHEQVDDKQAIRSYLPEAQCWHAGDNKGNTTSYALEMCVNADGDLAQTISNAVRVTILRLDELGLSASDVVGHHHWSGKNCPRVFRDNPGTWDKFIHAVSTRNPDYPILPGGVMSKFSSPLPIGCRFTSGFGTRAGILHAGSDFGPVKPGQTGTPVYAVHDGPVLATGYGYGRGSDRIPYHSGRYIWQDIGVHGGDRMRIYYGHLARSLVKSGQRVKAGQIIGYMGGSGSSGENHFLVHLHLGVSVNHNRPVTRWNARTNSGWTDPVRWLRSKGITVGRTKPATSTVGTASTSKTAVKLKPAKAGEWPTFALVVDGKYQSLTKRAYQRLLAPKNVGNYRGRIDAKMEGLTILAEQTWLKNLGYYKGRLDRQRGPMTVKALQSFLRDKGFYKGRIDGKFQVLSIKGLQQYLNSQRKHYK